MTTRWTLSTTLVALLVPVSHSLSIPVDSTSLWSQIGELDQRDTSSCGAGASLTQCSGSISQFSCCSGTQCLPLNTPSGSLAVLCCPDGSDCATLSPISCNTTFQDPSLWPASNLHASPVISLQTCGEACCPPGYNCNAGGCYASNAGASKSSTSATTSMSSSIPSSTLAVSQTSSTTSQVASSPTSSNASSVGQTAASSTATAAAKGSFSGAAFAAGFVPGIVLGALVMLGVIFCCARRRHTMSQRFTELKHHSVGRDTLTDLSPPGGHQTTFHGRSISEPTADLNLHYRTDFLHGTPPRQAGPDMDHIADRSTQSAKSSGNPGDGYPLTIKGLFSHSPFVNQASTPKLTQPPIPDHLKRGTLSYQISPVRALRKQRSFHSLRRHLTNATTRSNSSRQTQRAGVSRTASTETIQVLMQSPDTIPRIAEEPGSSAGPTVQPRHRDTATTWSSGDTTPIDEEASRFSAVMNSHPASANRSTTPPPALPPLPLQPSSGAGSVVSQSESRSAQAGGLTAAAATTRQYASSSRYPTEVFTPTRAGQGSGAAPVLGTPYTPTNFGLGGNGSNANANADKRVTTFSAMMESAGLRRSDWLGPGHGQGER